MVAIESRWLLCKSLVIMEVTGYYGKSPVAIEVNVCYGKSLLAMEVNDCYGKLVVAMAGHLMLWKITGGSKSLWLQLNVNGCYVIHLLL
jgi:hypothetical protein